MTEHRSVLLLQQVLAKLNLEIRPNPQDVTIECSMVELAEREPIGHDRSPGRIAVRDDVRRIEQFGVSEAADGPSLAISHENPPPESSLMDTLLHLPCQVRTTNAVRALAKELGPIFESLLCYI